jgi:SAM-dependent methyltransferase
MDKRESGLGSGAGQDIDANGQTRRAPDSDSDSVPSSGRRISFNAAASTYHRGRPPYPDAVFELLTDRCGLRPGARVLEIGAGNGLAAGPLLAAGAQVVAVEPGQDLAAILTATHACDRLEVTIADFETADIAGGFDLAVAATYGQPSRTSPNSPRPPASSS